MYGFRMFLRQPLRNALLAAFLAAASLFVWFSMEIPQVLYSSTQEIAQRFNTILIPRSYNDMIYLDYVTAGEELGDGRDGRITLPGHITENYAMLAYSDRFHPVISLTENAMKPTQITDNPYNIILFEGECIQASEENAGPQFPRSQRALLRVVDIHALHEDYPKPRFVETMLNLNWLTPMVVGQRYLVYLEDYLGDMLTDMIPVDLQRGLMEGRRDENAICSGSLPYRTKWANAQGGLGPDEEVIDEDYLSFVHLDGEAKDFLTSPQGAAWADRISYLHKALKSAELSAVESLDYVVAFRDGQAVMRQGRSFTQQDLDEGATVCILSAQLAKYSGLSIGDRLDLTLFDSQYMRFENISEEWIRPILPVRYTEIGKASFEIIGLYSLPEKQQNLYNFTQNSMFVPVKALSPQAAALAKRYSEPTTHLSSIVFHGRELDRFKDLAKTRLSNYDYAFLTIGGNYERFEASYQELLGSVALFNYIALPVWAALLLIYLVAFWYQNLRSAMLMRAQGLSPGMTAWQVFMHGFVPALPAVPLMLLLGDPLMQWAARSVMARGLSSLVDAQLITQAKIITYGQGVRGAAIYALAVLGVLGALLLWLSHWMARQSILRLLSHKE